MAEEVSDTPLLKYRGMSYGTPSGDRGVFIAYRGMLMLEMSKDTEALMGRLCYYLPRFLYCFFYVVSFPRDIE